MVYHRKSENLKYIREKKLIRRVSEKMSTKAGVFTRETEGGKAA